MEMFAVSRCICIFLCSVLSVAAAGGSGGRGRFSVCSARQTTIAQIILGDLQGHRPPINTTCRTQGPSELSLRARAALSNAVAEPQPPQRGFHQWWLRKKQTATTKTANLASQHPPLCIILSTTVTLSECLTLWSLLFALRCYVKIPQWWVI